MLTTWWLCMELLYLLTTCKCCSNSSSLCGYSEKECFLTSSLQCGVSHCLICSSLAMKASFFSMLHSLTELKSSKSFPWISSHFDLLRMCCLTWKKHNDKLPVPMLSKTFTISTVKLWGIWMHSWTCRRAIFWLGTHSEGNKTCTRA